MLCQWAEPGRVTAAWKISKGAMGTVSCHACCQVPSICFLSSVLAAKGESWSTGQCADGWVNFPEGLWFRRNGIPLRQGRCIAAVGGVLASKVREARPDRYIGYLGTGPCTGVGQCWVREGLDAACSLIYVFHGDWDVPITGNDLSETFWVLLLINDYRFKNHHGNTPFLNATVLMCML